MLQSRLGWLVSQRYSAATIIVTITVLILIRYYCYNMLYFLSLLYTTQHNTTQCLFVCMSAFCLSGHWLAGWLSRSSFPDIPTLADQSVPLTEVFLPEVLRLYGYRNYHLGKVRTIVSAIEG